MACRRARPRASSGRSSGRGSSSATPGGVLTPGPVLRAYARRETPGGDLVELAAGSLDRLARASGETVNLGVATADVGRDARPARQPAHSRLDELGRPPRPEPRLRRRQGLPRRGGRAVPRGAARAARPRARSPIRRRSRATSSAVRARGYATAVDELEPGLWAVAAPVRDAARRRRRRAQHLRARPSACTTRSLDELGALVRDEASTLSVRNGYDDPKRGAA